MRARTHSFVALLALAATLATQLAASAVPDLHLPFSDVDGGTVIDATANVGTAATEQLVVTAGEGAAIARKSPLPGDQAMALPHFDGEDEGQRAVLAVQSMDAEALNPGTNRFWMQADVRLHPVNSGSPTDNGNNVLQRGLYGGSQFKLQADDGEAMCRVAGATGAIVVRHTVHLQAGTWYRLTCRRIVREDGMDRLWLVVRPLQDLDDRVVVRSEIAEIGSLDFDQATPLSVGGKLRNNLTIPAASDQFNGRIDNVRLVVR